MEEKRLFKTGDRVDQMCVNCKEERGHIVTSVSKLGRVTRVSCPMCKSSVTYRAGTASRLPLNQAPRMIRGERIVRARY